MNTLEKVIEFAMDNDYPGGCEKRHKELAEFTISSGFKQRAIDFWGEEYLIAVGLING